MLLLIVFATVSIFLVLSLLILLLAGKGAGARLAEVAANSRVAPSVIFGQEGTTGISGLLATFSKLVKPIRDLIAGNDEDFTYRFTLAGYRKPWHIEVYVAAKLLLPVLALVGASFGSGVNLFLFALLGVTGGFLAPDLILTQMIARRRDSIQLALPNAVDLLVICMEAGLGIDQALDRVGQELRLSSPALSDELLTINREQRVGKPRLEAWRSMSERVDLDDVRQFVNMLVQTERFGTPIAHAMGQFSDGLRRRRTQKLEELAAKTTVKLIFPLVLFIFPSLFVVLLGPAMISISHNFAQAGN